MCVNVQVRSQEDADAHAIADPGEYRHRVNQDASQVRAPWPQKSPPADRTNVGFLGVIYLSDTQK